MIVIATVMPHLITEELRKSPMRVVDKDPLLEEEEADVNIEVGGAKIAHKRTFRHLLQLTTQSLNVVVQKMIAVSEAVQKISARLTRQGGPCLGIKTR